MFKRSCGLQFQLARSKSRKDTEMTKCLKPKFPPASKSIKLHCRECCGSSHEVKLCEALSCALFPFRFGRKPRKEDSIPDVISYPLEQGLTHIEAMDRWSGLAKHIRRRCLDCEGFDQAMVKRCEHKACHLHPYRMGKNPNRMREISPEERKRVGERLAAARKS